jgi:hypothetical protein
MKRITRVEALPDHKVRLRFDDGKAGVVDLSRDSGKGIFSAWNDPAHFASVKISHGGRSLEWPGEIDLCADALYLEIGGSITDVFPNWQRETTHA